MSARMRTMSMACKGRCNNGTPRHDLRVTTKTNKQIMLTMWTDRDHGNTAYFPIRLGYASNVHKVQGDEFDHVTICLDIENMPAAGYAALSRVEKCQELFDRR